MDHESKTPEGNKLYWIVRSQICSRNYITHIKTIYFHGFVTYDPRAPVAAGTNWNFPPLLVFALGQIIALTLSGVWVRSRQRRERKCRARCIWATNQAVDLDPKPGGAAGRKPFVPSKPFYLTPKKFGLWPGLMRWLIPAMRAVAKNWGTWT